MGRTRTFDVDAVLGTAGNLFRQRGYRDVSIAELERATGLVSGSIYNAFGDKAGLFEAALHHYVHGFVRQRLDRFAGEGATLDDLEQLFLSTLDMPLADGHGCLVTNSMIEFGRADGLATEEVGIALRMVREGIDGVLRRELGPGAAAVEAMRLVVLYQGILALSRSQTPFGEMAAVVRAEFDRLRGMRGAKASKR